MRISEACEVIKDRVTTAEAAAFYGVEVHNGKCKCFLHDDARPSMVIYPGKRGFFCFSCNQGGSVIDFVRGLLGISLKEAIQRINHDFNLGMDLDTPKVEVDEHLKQRHEEHTMDQLEHEALVRQYDTAYDLYRALEFIAAQNKPRTPQDLDDPVRGVAYAFAIKRLTSARESLDTADRMLCSWQMRKRRSA